MLTWWAGTNRSELLSQNMICSVMWSCHKSFSGILLFSGDWWEKLKTCLSLHNSPSLTPSVLHKPGRNLEIDEAFCQGNVFGNQSQNWNFFNFFIWLGSVERALSLIISLSQTFLSIDEPKFHWKETWVQPKLRTYLNKQTNKQKMTKGRFPKLVTQ